MTIAGKICQAVSSIAKIC